ncbi:hypothetical protein Taro_038372 [Colocasia esculenta]|uniref:Uncharacterized protein n=1 Tax=Colocasia esculenta TaxID=4460 RepID=A0A843WM23_COLES|nr:hypothetical protein [Colocasia esculenta]
MRRTNRSPPSQRRGTSPEDLRERILERQTASSFAGTRERFASEYDFSILLPRLVFLTLLKILCKLLPLRLAFLALFSDFALETCLLGFSRDFVWHLVLELCICGILQDLMQTSAAEAGLLGFVQ